jgi:hypothetical protein
MGAARRGGELTKINAGRQALGYVLLRLLPDRARVYGRIGRYLSATIERPAGERVKAIAPCETEETRHGA